MYSLNQTMSYKGGRGTLWNNPCATKGVEVFSKRITTVERCELRSLALSTAPVSVDLIGSTHVNDFPLAIINVLPGVIFYHYHVLYHSDNLKPKLLLQLEYVNMLVCREY